ncbi:hypothetical protein VTJ04DRAFT_2323 [Mycothermus thermophilus]|uniref:uncharacterized protein n=1 Tax=Humicola insolens TaxID=85995 RepID=UPI0037449EEE
MTDSPLGWSTPLYRTHHHPPPQTQPGGRGWTLILIPLDASFLTQPLFLFLVYNGAIIPLLFRLAMQHVSVANLTQRTPTPIPTAELPTCLPDRLTD